MIGDVCAQLSKVCADKKRHQKLRRIWLDNQAASKEASERDRIEIEQSEGALLSKRYAPLGEERAHKPKVVGKESKTIPLCCYGACGRAAGYWFKAGARPLPYCQEHYEKIVIWMKTGEQPERYRRKSGGFARPGLLVLGVLLIIFAVILITRS